MNLTSLIVRVWRVRWSHESDFADTRGCVGGLMAQCFRWVLIEWMINENEVTAVTTTAHRCRQVDSRLAATCEESGVISEAWARSRRWRERWLWWERQMAFLPATVSLVYEGFFFLSKSGGPTLGLSFSFFRRKRSWLAIVFYCRNLFCGPDVMRGATAYKTFFYFVFCFHSIHIRPTCRVN